MARLASNGTDSRVGSLTADWERCFEWKRVEREDEPRRVSLEVMLRGTCEPSRLLDLIENFVLYADAGAAVIERVLAHEQHGGGLGQTIGSEILARIHRLL